MARTPVRQMRIADDLWDRVNAAAKGQGSDATKFTRAALEAALADPQTVDPAETGNGADAGASRPTQPRARRTPPSPPVVPAAPSSASPDLSSGRAGTTARVASSSEARGQIRPIPKTPGARKPPPKPGKK